MSKTLSGVHIFKSGTWNKSTFTDDDLDSIVQSFNAAQLAGRVPLKFGHNDEQSLTDGKPALGWVSRVWRTGSNLMADFSDIPSAVYDFIKKGLYKFTSIELLKNAEYDGKKFPYLLDAVALLGADPPAVDGLESMQKLALSRASFKFEEAMSFSKTPYQFTGDRNHMTEAEVQAAIAKGIADGLAAQKVKDEAAAAERLKFTNENAALKKKLEEQEAAAKAEKVKFSRDRVTQVLEGAARGKIITPAQREAFSKSLKVADDDAVLLIDMEVVEAMIGIKAAKALEFMKDPKSQSFSRDPKADGNGTAKDGDNVDENSAKMMKFVGECHKYAREHGISSFEASPIVMQMHPEFQQSFLDHIFDNEAA